MTTILVAVICNVVAALICFGGILNSAKNSWKLALTKFCLTVGAGIGIYFATPALADLLGKILINGIALPEVLATAGISIASINALIFAILFMVAYTLIAINCKIIKHFMIKSFRNTSDNAAKLKRAKSINSKAEKLARRVEWRQLKEQYKNSNSTFKRIISIILGALTGVILSLIALMPFGYIAEDLNAAGKIDLETGFNYTLNGVIDDNIDFKVFDWLISVEENKADEPETCEHNFIEGICEICGETEATIEG